MRTMKNNNKDWACLERSLSVSVSEAVSNDEPFVGSPHAPVSSRPAKVGFGTSKRCGRAPRLDAHSRYALRSFAKVKPGRVCRHRG